LALGNSIIKQGNLRTLQEAADKPDTEMDASLEDVVLASSSTYIAICSFLRTKDSLHMVKLSLFIAQRHYHM